MKHLLLLPALAGCLAAASCTGDPSKGGIFYSREQQAVRTANLKQTNLDAAAQAAREEQAVGELTKSQGSLTSELARMGSEQTELQSQLNGIDQRIREGAVIPEPSREELAKVRAQLSESQRNLKTAEELERQADASDLQAVAARKARIAELKAVNDQLRDQIRLIGDSLTAPKY